MKNIILLIMLLTMASGVCAQKTPTQTVANIETEKAIQIIESATKELNYPLKQFDSKNKIIITDWIEWKSIAITNHAKLKLEAKDNRIVIAMIERQYKSSDGWSDSPTKLSKRNHKKYLGVMATKIKSIADNEKQSRDAVYNSELIRMFNPVVNIQGLEWKFIKGIKDAPAGSDKYQKMKTPNYLIELSVTNTTNSTQLINLDDVHFRDPHKKNAGTANGYSAVSFNEVNISLGYRIKKLEIVSGETKKVFIYSMIKNFDLVPNDIIPFFKFKYRIENQKREIKNYNMPIPFENKFE